MKIFLSFFILSWISSSFFHIEEYDDTLLLSEHVECLNSIQERYLELLKRCLVNSIYQDSNANPYGPANYNSERRDNGRDWPSLAHTMIGKKRLNTTHFCIKQIFENNIVGDFVETGVWRGGTSIFMKATLDVFDEKNRKIWAADTFNGVPSPNIAKFPVDGHNDYSIFPQLKVSLEEVKANFLKYNFSNENVIFLKGLFSETLPSAPIESIALLSVNGLMYESTMDSLSNLYPKISKGGYLIIQDYYLPACKQAVTDYRQANSITEEIIDIDGVGVYWKKE